MSNQLIPRALSRFFLDEGIISRRILEALEDGATCPQVRQELMWVRHVNQHGKAQSLRLIAQIFGIDEQAIRRAIMTMACSVEAGFRAIARERAVASARELARTMADCSGNPTELAEMKEASIALGIDEVTEEEKRLEHRSAVQELAASKGITVLEFTSTGRIILKCPGIVHKDNEAQTIRHLRSLTKPQLKKWTECWKCRAINERAKAAEATLAQFGYKPTGDLRFAKLNRRVAVSCVAGHVSHVVIGALNKRCADCGRKGEQQHFVAEAIAA